MGIIESHLLSFYREFRGLITENEKSLSVRGTSGLKHLTGVLRSLRRHFEESQVEGTPLVNRTS